MSRKIPNYLKNRTSIEDLRGRVSNLVWDLEIENVDMSDAIEADIEKQGFWGYSARPWYVDFPFICKECDEIFTFTADEQRLWYESYGFHPASRPLNCLECGTKLRQNKNLKKIYDSYNVFDDGSLSAKEAQNLANIMLDIFELPFSEKLAGRHSHLLKISNGTARS